VPKKTQRISDLQATIALQIVEYIKDNDLEKGQHLTEEKFAALFGVSRTPVRATLNYLEKIGVLKVVANRGYFLAVTPGSINLRRLGIPMSEEEKLYSNVVRDIVRGHWKEEVTEIDLIRRYEVQRGLVTRVLWRLAKEGVVERSAGVGWTIQPILNSPEAVMESYRVRVLVEPSGLLEPTYAPDLRKLAKSREQHEELLRKGAHKISRTEFFETNAAFHEMLAAMSGNRFFAQMIKQQNKLRRLMEYKARHIDRLTESCQEHIAIIDALEAGDRDWAAHLLRHHLQTSSRLYQESFLSRTGQRDDAAEPVEA
jgi:DNA-binding GntR family transcriptional regulator